MDELTGGASGTKKGLFTKKTCDVKFSERDCTSILKELDFLDISPNSQCTELSEIQVLMLHCELTEGSIPDCTFTIRCSCDPKFLALESNVSFVFEHVVLPRIAQDDTTVSRQEKHTLRSTEGASNEISMGFDVLQVRDSVTVNDEYVPPKLADVLHAMEESEYQRLERHAVFSLKEAAIDSW
jgi:hypothetical protein